MIICKTRPAYAKAKIIATAVSLSRAVCRLEMQIEYQLKTWLLIFHCYGVNDAEILIYARL